MQTINFSRQTMRSVDSYGSMGVANVRIGGGTGESHVYALRIDAGGNIGAHPAGYGQLFLVVEGEAWAAGPDGTRVTLPAGHGVYIEPGELHSKGSDTGASVLMVQAESVAPDSGAFASQD